MTMECSGLPNSWICQSCMSKNSTDSGSCRGCKAKRLLHPFSSSSMSLKDVEYVDCSCDESKGARPKQKKQLYDQEIFINQKPAKSRTPQTREFGRSIETAINVENLHRWPCEKCSNLNVQSVQFCTSCGIGKEKEVILINDDDDYTVTYNHINTEQTTNKMAASDQTVVMDLDKLEDWCCRRCTLNNSSDKTRCEMCESPREIRVPTVDDSNDISTASNTHIHDRPFFWLGTYMHFNKKRRG